MYAHVQNNLAELYALLALAVPSVFPIGMADAFVAAFADAVKTVTGSSTTPVTAATGSLTMVDLQHLLAPILLRRTLTDVGLDMPPLTESLLQCPMTALQKEWYKSVLRGHVAQLVAARSSSSSTAGLQNALVQLRKVCNHPYLFPGAEPEPYQVSHGCDGDRFQPLSQIECVELCSGR